MKIALLAAATLALLVGVAGAAPQLVGSDFRISNVGDKDAANREAGEPAQAYNPAANEYLVVWAGDGLDTDDEVEIFGQRLDANGAEIGEDFPISTVGPEKEVNPRAAEPAVTFNPATSQYLVAWRADDLVDGEFEIFGQLLDANGAKASGELRISNETEVAADRDSLDPALTYNSATNQYLVVWQGTSLVNPNQLEIFGQLLNADGTEFKADFPISNLSDVGTTRSASGPALAYNPTANEYLVSWAGDGLATPSEFEIFGQRLGGDGGALGGDFPISDVGPEKDETRAAADPALAYNPATNQYLVVWQGDGLDTDDESEIFGQRLGGTGAEVGGDFRISNTGTDGDPERGVFRPAITYNPRANEYLVAWGGNGLVAPSEVEIFAQPLSADGAEIGADLRISNVGADGDPLRLASSAALTYNPAANEYLAVWAGGNLADNEFEIFGRRLAEPIIISDPQPTGKCAGVAATKTGTAGADVIKGTAKRDVIAALGGRDTVRSLGGNDLVCGGAGNDRVFGGKGKDKLRGDAGADKLNGDSGNDDLRGDKGRDVLKGGPGKDALAGGPGTDTERQ